MQIKQTHDLTGKDRYCEYYIKAETPEERRSIITAINIFQENPTFFDSLPRMPSVKALMGKNEIQMRCFMKIDKYIKISGPAEQPIYIITVETPKESMVMTKVIKTLKETFPKPVRDSSSFCFLTVFPEAEKEVEKAAEQLSRTLNCQQKVKISDYKEDEVYHANAEELYRIRKASEKVSHMLTQIPEYYDLPWPLKQCVLGQRTYAVKSSEFRKYQNG